MQLVRLVRQYEQLQRMAGRDPLTGLLNRCQFEERLQQEFEDSRRTQRPFSIAILDIDNFKLVNDTYGHDTGDDVLRKVGLVLRSKTRKSDMQIRYGGEEFVLVLHGANLGGAVHVGKKICQGIGKLNFSTQVSTFSVTASVGVASSSAKQYSHWKEILKDADRALYAAKASGKNCVRAASKAHSAKRQQTTDQQSAISCQPSAKSETQSEKGKKESDNRTTGQQDQEAKRK